MLASGQYRRVTPPPPTIILTNTSTTVTVHPDEGGRIGQIDVDGQPLLREVPEPAERDHIGWGMYPMAPWAGRIREGRFSFEGTAHQLEINHRDGDGQDPRRAHSMHGTTHQRAWTVTDQTDSTIDLQCPLAGALDWPFEGVALQRIGVTARGLTLEMVVEAAAGRFPAEIGWHPWFLKPDRLEFTPALMYRRDVFGLPNRELVEPNSGPWDDCFTNTSPVVLHYDRLAARAVRVESDCDHWVVYDEPTDATCVEPQSGPPDAFNLVHHVVTPTSPLRRRMTIAW